MRSRAHSACQLKPHSRNHNRIVSVTSLLDRPFFVRSFTSTPSPPFALIPYITRNQHPAVAGKRSRQRPPGNRPLQGTPYLQVHTNSRLICIVISLISYGALECLAKLLRGCKYGTETGIMQCSTEKWKFSSYDGRSTEVGHWVNRSTEYNVINPRFMK